MTVLAVAAVAVYLPGPLRHLPILIGGIIGYIIYLIFANGFGLGKAIDFTGLSNAAWVGLPNFTTRNLITVAVALTLGAGNFVLNVGTFSIGGIGTATFGSIILYQILRERGTKPEEVATADAAVNVEPGDKGSLEAGAGE